MSPQVEVDHPNSATTSRANASRRLIAGPAGAYRSSASAAASAPPGCFCGSWLDQMMVTRSRSLVNASLGGQVQPDGEVKRGTARVTTASGSSHLYHPDRPLMPQAGSWPPGSATFPGPGRPAPRRFRGNACAGLHNPSPRRRAPDPRPARGRPVMPHTARVTVVRSVFRPR
jgi:hypothetical protein